MSGVVVTDHVQVLAGMGGSLLQEAQELAAVAGVACAGDRAGGDLQHGEQGGGAVADVVVGLPFGDAWAHRQDQPGPVRGLDLGFSSAQTATAFCCGARYRSTTSRILAFSCGPVENLKPEVRCGWRQNLRYRTEIESRLTLMPLARRS